MNRIVKLVLDGPSLTTKRRVQFAAIVVMAFLAISMVVTIAELVQGLKDLYTLGFFTTP